MNLSIPAIFPSTESLQSYALFGDYFGGFWGTMFSAGTLIVVVLTWSNSRHTEHRNSILVILGEMLQTHDTIVSTKPKLTSNVNSDFSTVYRITKSVEPNDDIWNIDARIDIAYTYAFYGPSTGAQHALSTHGAEKVTAVHNAVSNARNLSITHGGNTLRGYQAYLSQYMRNLFGMFDLIDSSNLSLADKKRLGKIVRTKLSNYDQAVLALNVISHLGRDWEEVGFITRYKPFSNVPKLFFGIDDKINLKERFPNVDFEWEKHNRKGLGFWSGRFLRIEFFFRWIRK